MNWLLRLLPSRSVLYFGSAWEAQKGEIYFGGAWIDLDELLYGPGEFLPATKTAEVVSPGRNVPTDSRKAKQNEHSGSHPTPCVERVQRRAGQESDDTKNPGSVDPRRPGGWRDLVV